MRSRGRPRSNHAKPHVNSQRYSESEMRMLKRIAGKCPVSEFIHAAAIDRAAQFSQLEEEASCPRISE